MIDMTVEIKRIRIGTDIRMRVNFSVAGSQMSWDDVSDISCWLICDSQRTRHDDVTFEIGGTPEDLYVKWLACNQRYDGLYRLAVRFVIDGDTRTFGAPAFELVKSSEGIGSYEYTLVTEDGLNVVTEGNENESILITTL